MKDVEFSVLKGEMLWSIEVSPVKDYILFTLIDGRSYQLVHHKD